MSLSLEISKDAFDRRTELRWVWHRSIEKVVYINDVDLAMYREPEQVIITKLTEVFSWLVTDCNVDPFAANVLIGQYHDRLAKEFISQLEPVTVYIRTKAKEENVEVDEAVREPLPEARLVQSFTEGLAESIKAIFTG